MTDLTISGRQLTKHVSRVSGTLNKLFKLLTSLDFSQRQSNKPYKGVALYKLLKKLLTEARKIADIDDFVFSTCLQDLVTQQCTLVILRITGLTLDFRLCFAQFEELFTSKASTIRVRLSNAPTLAFIREYFWKKTGAILHFVGRITLLLGPV